MARRTPAPAHQRPRSPPRRASAPRQRLRHGDRGSAGPVVQRATRDVNPALRAAPSRSASRACSSASSGAITQLVRHREDARVERAAGARGPAARAESVDEPREHGQQQPGEPARRPAATVGTATPSSSGVGTASPSCRYPSPASTTSHSAPASAAAASRRWSQRTGAHQRGARHPQVRAGDRTVEPVARARGVRESPRAARASATAPAGPRRRRRRASGSRSRPARAGRASAAAATCARPRAASPPRPSRRSGSGRRRRSQAVQGSPAASVPRCRCARVDRARRPPGTPAAVGERGD